MIIHECEQGSSEWHSLRSGIPTASEFSRIVTPIKWEASASAEKFLNELIHAKRVGYREDDDVNTPDMQWGTEHEQDAVDCFEFQDEVETVKIGFATDDRGRYGCSIDRAIQREVPLEILQESLPEGIELSMNFTGYRFFIEDELLEVKCPKGSTHVSYLRNRSVEREKLPQLMGQLLVFTREPSISIDEEKKRIVLHLTAKKNNIISFHPKWEPVIIEVPRDETKIETLRILLESFCDKLDSVWSGLSTPTAE